MKAYAVASELVTDAEMFERYRAKATETIQPFGGRFLTRGGGLSILEGEWPFPRLVIIEFPSRADAETWYRSCAYQGIIPLRLKSTKSDFVIVDGVPE